VTNTQETNTSPAETKEVVTKPEETTTTDTQNIEKSPAETQTVVTKPEETTTTVQKKKLKHSPSKYKKLRRHQKKSRRKNTM